MCLNMHLNSPRFFVATTMLIIKYLKHHISMFSTNVYVFVTVTMHVHKLIICKIIIQGVLILIFVIAMSQQTLPCVLPPRNAEGGSIFLYRCLVFPQKIVLKRSLNASEIFKLKDTENVFFSAYSLKPNFNKLNIYR